MRYLTCALLTLAAACNGDGRDRHDLEELIGRTYETGATGYDDPVALVVDSVPIDNFRLRATLIDLDPLTPSRDYTIELVRDDRFEDIVIGYVDDFPNGYGWTWMRILDRGRVLDYGLLYLATPFIPDAPEYYSFNRYFAVAFEDTE